MSYGTAADGDTYLDGATPTRFGPRPLNKPATPSVLYIYLQHNASNLQQVGSCASCILWISSIDNEISITSSKFDLWKEQYAKAYAWISIKVPSLNLLFDGIVRKHSSHGLQECSSASIPETIPGPSDSHFYCTSHKCYKIGRASCRERV